jgi:alpha-ketoglutarate-dependent 2,4-dichlorophenoxyacetate dioxygenase
MLCSADNRALEEFRAMALSFRQLHPTFGAEVSPIDLRQAMDPQVMAEICAAMDQYAVLVFRNQTFTDQQQMEFAERCDGVLHIKTGSSVLKNTRLSTEAVSDISNLDADNTLIRADDRRRLYSLGNRLWHTDASFQDPAGRYSMLSARVLPVDGGPDTQFADTRSAYDALPDECKASLQGLRVQHSIAH